MYFPEDHLAESCLYKMNKRIFGRTYLVKSFRLNVLTGIITGLSVKKVNFQHKLISLK